VGLQTRRFVRLVGYIRGMLGESTWDMKFIGLGRLDGSIYDAHINTIMFIMLQKNKIND
jgi:hypothetical protein